MQFDLFDDSRDTALRNDAIDALQRRDQQAASSACRVLAEACPGDALLAPMRALREALADAGAPIDSHEALKRRQDALSGALHAAAVAVFGASDGRRWLLPLWRALAERAAALPFRAEHAGQHAAPLWLQAQEWSAAARAAAGIPSWRRIPAPLAWAAHARWKLEGLDGVWPLLVELAWLAPARLDALCQAVADPLMERLRKTFDANFDGDGTVDDLVWFPAWVLTQKSGLARLLAAAEPSRDAAPERTLRLLVELIGLEQQGRQREMVERRKALRDLHGGLYAAYMALR